MKKSIKMIVMLFVTLLTINFNNIVNASAKNYVTNSNGVDIDIEKYQNFKKMGFTDEDIDSMTLETYESYNDMDMVIKDKTVVKFFKEITIKDYFGEKTVLEEISEEDYLNEKEDNNYMRGSASTTETYKKLSAESYSISTTNLSKRLVLAKLEWKKMPKNKSYDIFAARITGGEILKNSFSGSITVTESTFDGNCAISGTKDHVTTYNSANNAWNKHQETSTSLGYTGLGFTGKLNKNFESCTNDLGTFVSTPQKYSASLGFQAATGAKVFITYQHAIKSVNYNSVRSAYSFSSNGLGGVVYFNSNLKNSYDNMKGISFTV